MKIYQSFVITKSIAAMIQNGFKWMILVLSLITAMQKFSFVRDNDEKVKNKIQAVYIHPYFLSVVEIEHIKSDNILGITCRIFTDDFEKTLRSNYNKPVDLVNVKDRAVTDKLIADYISKHLQLKADGKPLTLKYIGFEKQQEAVYCYFEVSGIASVQKLGVFVNLLHEYKPEQVNLIHVTVNGKRQSTKLDNPESKAEFTF